MSLYKSPEYLYILRLIPSSSQSSTVYTYGRARSLRLMYRTSSSFRFFLHSAKCSTNFVNWSEIGFEYSMFMNCSRARSSLYYEFGRFFQEAKSSFSDYSRMQTRRFFLSSTPFSVILRLLGRSDFLTRDHRR